MSRIQPLAPNAGDSSVQATLAAVKAKLGMVPNLFSTLALAPAALNGYLALSDALGKGQLTAAQREIVALATAQANSCQYCLSAHTYIGKGAGLNDQAISAARLGSGHTALDNAIAVLATQLTKQAGQLTDSDLATAKTAGVSEALLLEVVVNVSLNILTNYVNHVAQTDVDFPIVALSV